MCNMLTTCCHCDDIVIIVQWIFDDFWIQIAQGPSSACAASVQLLARQACESYSCSAAKGLMKVPNAKKVGGDDDKVGTRASNYHKSPDPAEIISEWHSSELVGCLFVVGNCQILSAVCVCVFVFLPEAWLIFRHAVKAKNARKCGIIWLRWRTRSSASLLQTRLYTCVYNILRLLASFECRSKWKPPCCWRFWATAVCWASFPNGRSSESEWLHCHKRNEVNAQATAWIRRSASQSIPSNTAETRRVVAPRFVAAPQWSLTHFNPLMILTDS